MSPEWADPLIRASARDIPCAGWVRKGKSATLGTKSLRWAAQGVSSHRDSAGLCRTGLYGPAPRLVPARGIGEGKVRENWAEKTEI